MTPDKTAAPPCFYEDPQDLTKSLLFRAVCDNDSKAINQVLNENTEFDINSQINDEETALLIAAKFTCYNAVETLLKRGADVKSRGKHGYQAIHHACSAQGVKVLNALVQKDEDVVNETCNKGWSPLHIAAKQGKLKNVEFLINNGSQLNAVTDAKNSALILALASGHKDVADYLLSQEKIDVNIANSQGVTAFHQAALLNDSNIVMSLVYAGADANVESKKSAKTNKSYTPFQLIKSKEIKNMIDFTSLPGSSASFSTASSLSNPTLSFLATK